ncbi:MAG TPA: DUF6320 domain-containing protein [Ohtaekwangia sp.]
MTICRECGVELDDDMKSCPLCDTLVSNRERPPSYQKTGKAYSQPEKDKKHLMQRLLWQITAVLLLSGVVATFIINLSIDASITWSIYPISICLMILAYASFMAFWRKRFVFQLVGGWLISALLLAAVNWYIQEDWPLFLALPILSVVNTIGIVLYFLLARLKTKGLNVLALVSVSFAVVSLGVEAVISLYFSGNISLGWSAIVAACLLPVTAAILFIYFKTRNNSDLQKIFHT